MTGNRMLLGSVLAVALAAPTAVAQTTAPATRRAATATAPAPAVASTAPAKPLPSRPIPPAIKSATTVPPAAVLDGFIRPEVSNLASSDPKVQALARAALEDGVLTGTVGVDPSTAFLRAYAATLSREVVALLRSPRGADWRARLNAAIAVGRVAERLEGFNGDPRPEKVDTSVLAPATIALADDKLAPVALWGVKAAKFVVPRQMDAKPPVPPAQSAAAAVVRAVMRFPTLDVIAEDGYDALTGQSIATNRARHGAAVPHVQALLRARTGMYDKVNVDAATAVAEIIAQLPGMPAADKRGLILLSQSWGSTTKQQQQQSAQTMINLLKEVSQIVQSPLWAPRAPGDTESVGKEDLIAVIQEGGSVTMVVGGGNTELKNAAAAVKKINVNTLPADVDRDVLALEAAYGAAGLLPTAAAAAANPK